MTQLTKDTPGVFGLSTADPEDCEDIDVSGSSKIYQGSAVGLNAGDGGARQLVGGDDFLGFAITRADNSGNSNASVFDAGTVPGSGVVGNITIPTQPKGVAYINVTQTGVLTGARSDRDVRVYASDGATFTDVSSGNSQIGSVQRFISQVSGTGGSGVGYYQVAFRSVDLRNS
jgi:hypothetical protein